MNLKLSFPLVPAAATSVEIEVMLNIARNLVDKSGLTCPGVSVNWGWVKEVDIPEGHCLSGSELANALLDAYEALRLIRASREGVLSEQGEDNLRKILSRMPSWAYSSRM